MKPHEASGVAGRLAGAGLLAATLTACLVATALADAAPPQFAPGAGPGPGGFRTNVQMVREDVRVTVGDAVSPTLFGYGLASDQIAGQVTATFRMRNLGPETESFEVWFPLERHYEEAIGEGFAARVDGRAAPATERTLPGPDDHSGDQERWATWPATFPPGQDVVLEVAYGLRPTGYMPYGTFGYSLDTGAGWRGPIGEGSVTFRLPHAVNVTNTALSADSMWDTGIKPAGFEVSGPEVIWRFSDLEPTAADNIRLTVLTPHVWRALERARAAAAAEPDSAGAQADLGRALAAALYTNKDMGVVEVADSVALAGQAEAAFRRAVALAPEDLGILLDYLDYLVAAYPFYAFGDAPEAFHEGVERAIALAPENERVRELRDWRDQDATATPALATQAAAATAARATVRALDTRVHGTQRSWTAEAAAGRATAPPAEATGRPAAGGDGRAGAPPDGRAWALLLGTVVVLAGLVGWSARRRKRGGERDSG